MILALCLFSFFIIHSSSLSFAGETADIVMKAGADYRAKLAWTDKAGKPVNLSGNSYSAQFRSAAYPSGILFASYSCIVTDAAKGQMQLRLSRQQTVTLSGKSGIWDFRQTDAGGLVTYRFGGSARVMPVVTTP